MKPYGINLNPMQDSQIQDLLKCINEDELNYHQFIVMELQKAETQYQSIASSFKEAEKALLSAQGSASMWVKYLSSKYKTSTPSTPSLDSPVPLNEITP